MKPITPTEAKQEIIQNFPDFVIEAVNNCIRDNYFGKQLFTVYRKDVVAEIIKVSPESITDAEICKKHWLDFEKIFSEYGWKITYHSPCYGDSNFEPYFKFEVLK